MVQSAEDRNTLQHFTRPRDGIAPSAAQAASRTLSHTFREVNRVNLFSMPLFCINRLGEPKAIDIAWSWDPVLQTSIRTRTGTIHVQMRKARGIPSSTTLGFRVAPTVLSTVSLIYTVLGL